MKKPKGTKVLVRYPEDEKNWYEGTVKSLLSIQFTCEYEVDGKREHRFYFYNDFKTTWKEKQDVGVKSRTRDRRKNNR